MFRRALTLCLLATPLLTAMPLLTATPLLTSCSSTNSCTDLDCTSGVTVVTNVSISQAELLKATISACRKSGSTTSCSSIVPPSVPTGSADAQQYQTTGELPASLRLSYVGTNSYKIEMAFSLEGQVINDSDQFGVDVTKADKSSAASLYKVPQYVVSTPNGASCPPLCKNATIQ